MRDIISALALMAGFVVYVIGLDAIGLHGTTLSLVAVASFIGMLLALGATRSQNQRTRH